MTPPKRPTRLSRIVGSFDEEVKALAAAAERFFSGGYAKKASPVVGPLSEEQWLGLHRRHMEHHLSQFGA